MPDDKNKPDHSNFGSVIRSATEFGSKLGTDALVFCLVISGVFAALWNGAHAGYTVSAGIAILLMWLVNKAINAYLEQRRADARLRELKATDGRILLGKHRRKKSLPAPTPKEPQS